MLAGDDPEQVRGEILRVDQQTKESAETGLYLIETQRAIPWTVRCG
ncbi:MAG: hypothetical protein GY820_02050 [Gammaproteobacteria bacterium]|nr:hypothetical protein [Gammaproteobacteria bacterium]